MSGIQVNRTCKIRSYYLILLVSINLGISYHQPNAAPLSNQSRITYLLSIDETSWRSFRISITVEHIQASRLIFALPKRVPGICTPIELAKLIQNFQAMGEQNKVLDFEKIAADRWLVPTTEQSAVRVIYDVVLGNSNFAGFRLNSAGALIQNAMVFMYLEEYTQLPMFVRFQVPMNWKIATSLHPTAYLYEYTAENYDMLLDAPTQMGRFQDYYFTLENKTLNVIVNRMSNFNIDKFMGMIRKIARTQALIFNELPFTNYYFMFEVFHDNSLTRTVGHRAASTYEIPRSHLVKDVASVAPLVAREFFKMWNGRNIRSLVFDPTSSSFTDQYTTSWFSEGVTQYYADLTLVRADIWSEEQYRNRLADRISRFQQNPYRDKLSVEDASLQNWQIGMDEDLCQEKGYLLGLLLDLKIREVTQNLQSLDNLFRFLNWWFAKADQTYTAGDLRRAVNTVAQTDLDYFFQRYVSGTVELPIGSYLNVAGYRLAVENRSVPNLKPLPELDQTNRVITLEANAPLARAGLKIGDEIVALDTAQVESAEDWPALLEKYAQHPLLRITVKRNAITDTLKVNISRKKSAIIRVEPVSNANEMQLRIRQSWLKSPATTAPPGSQPQK